MTVCWALAHWPAMRMLSKPAPSGGKEGGSGKVVPGGGSSTFKARKLRVTSGQPWADVGRGFAVAMTHRKAGLFPGDMVKGGFENSWFHCCSRRENPGVRRGSFPKEDRNF